MLYAILRWAGVLSVALIASATPTDRPADWKMSCAPDAAITPSTTHTDLVVRYGKQNVVDAEVYVGEGFTEPGTILFPDAPERRLELIWHDKNERRQPARAFTPLETKRSRWQVQGVALLLDLKTLERMNLKPFGLAGFGWDYAGTVTGWSGGEMEKLETPRCRFLVRLDARQKLNSEERSTYHTVAGEGRFSSSHPAMQKLNPRVYQIGFFTDKPGSK
jgi:hypothetical protein